MLFTCIVQPLQILFIQVQTGRFEQRFQLASARGTRDRCSNMGFSRQPGEGDGRLRSVVFRGDFIQRVQHGKSFFVQVSLRATASHAFPEIGFGTVLAAQEATCQGGVGEDRQSLFLHQWEVLFLVFGPLHQVV